MADEFLTVKEFKQFQLTCHANHEAVKALESWISKVDGRLWAIVIGLLFNGIIGVAALLMIVIKGAPK